MGYVAARCPNCGGDFQLNDNMEKGYCMHCGSPIYFKDAVQKIKIEGSLEINGIATLENLIKLIKKDLEHGLNQTIEFRERLSRALELDPGNQFLYNLHLSKIWNARILDGRLIEYQGNTRKVVIPDCIIIINKYAFISCYKLRTVIMPKSISLIMDDAFYKEDSLIIHAYKNTYAARYALASPARLHIIDDYENNQPSITKIENLIKEITAYKNAVINDEITKYYEKKVFLRILRPFFFNTFVLLSLFIIFAVLELYLPAFLVMLTAIVIYVLLAKKSKEYNNECRKLAAQNQIKRFIETCSNLLEPLGINNFRYEKDIWQNSDINLKHEVRHIKIVKDQLINMDRKQFLRNAEIHLSFVVFIFNKIRNKLFRR